MNKTQIPIYRAKKIDSDERVEGFLSHRSKGVLVIKGFPIDPSTLAIHFHDMIDSEGTKIFASLNEDGKGGDSLEVEYSYNGTSDRRIRNGVALFTSHFYSIQCKIGGESMSFAPNYFTNTKVTGIQE